MTYVLKQNGETLRKGHEADVREVIERLLEDRVGVFVSLQENVEEGYHFYLHSDNDDDLTEGELTMLDAHYGINTHDEEASEFAIRELLKITIEEVKA